MVQDTVNIPISLMIFLGGIIVSGLGAMLSFCGHLLISIRNSVSVMTTKMQVSDKETDARLKVLERHDNRNEEQRSDMERWQMQQLREVRE
jgi:hypothetical protein